MALKLTVSIVAYNNYEDIIEALVSMEKYTSSTLQKKIFIVDNGVSISSSSSVEKFKEFLSKDDNIEYIDAGGNIGFGKGHNKVIPYMESEYHAIVNPDILFCDDAFSKIVNWMDNNKDIGMVIPLYGTNGVLGRMKHLRDYVYRQSLASSFQNFFGFNSIHIKSPFQLIS